MKNDHRSKCVETCPKQMIYEKNRECHPCHKNCHPETNCSGPENYKCNKSGSKQCRNDALNVAQISQKIERKMQTEEGCYYSLNNENFPFFNDTAKPDINQCVTSCDSMKICRNLFGKVSHEIHFYTDEKKKCQICHESCRFFGCINGESGPEGGCQKDGCYETVQDGRHIFHGHKCSEKITQCNEKCKHKYGCELDASGNFVRKVFFNSFHTNHYNLSNKFLFRTSFCFKVSQVCHFIDLNYKKPYKMFR